MADDRTIVIQDDLHTTMSGQVLSSPVLLQYDGGAAGKRFVLSSNPITVGRRADKVQVWIDDASVSREHCKIHYEGTKAIVTDLGSLNGTFVNDTKVTEAAELLNGDMLKVGNVRLRYFAHGSADQLLFDRIYRMAVQDRMLEVFRKEYFLEKLDEDFRAAKASKSDLALLFIDLDKFKGINDTHGHDAGDHVLKEVCALIKTKLRKFDTFGRYGGEEFCLLLPKTTREEAIAFAEELRSNCERMTINYEGVIIPVTLSIGVAALSDKVATPQDMIKTADGFVYMSKQNGRNRVSA